MGTLKEAEALLQEQMNAAGAEQAAQKAASRDSRIVRASAIGIFANVALAAFKAVIGTMTHSIAITLDAVNNLSDAGSSVITIAGTKLAGKEPDKKHPFGYGRVEYLSAMLISVIVLYAGITSLTESVKSILHPETPDYSAASLVIIAAAVIVKLMLGTYARRTGESTHSDSLVNSGRDALMDAVISASTLLAAGIYLIFHVSLEAWLGAVIALVIVKSGVGMLRETLSEILGERADAKLAVAIKKTVTGFPQVRGAYDLILNNYGPDKFNGSIHIDVPDTLSAADLDDLLRRIQVKVYMDHHVVLTAIGIYSVNTHDPEAAAMEQHVRGLVMAVPHVLQMHGFYVDKPHHVLRFDVVISFDSPDRHETYRQVVKRVKEAYPDYLIAGALDTDYSEL